MDLTLTRRRFNDDGIFGDLKDDAGRLSLSTLEHSYSRIPKLMAGTYACMRGRHLLKRSPVSFETFEITGVPDHTGILFHMGNTNDDSDGCVLLGIASGDSSIFSSRDAFELFMEAEQGVRQFSLTVKDVPNP